MKKVFSSEDILASNLFASLLKEKGFTTRVQELRGIYFASKYDVFVDVNVSEAVIEEVRNQMQLKPLSLVDQNEGLHLKRKPIFKWVLWLILIYAFSGIIYSFLDFFKK